jgi:hypothetical protein
MEKRESPTMASMIMLKYAVKDCQTESPISSIYSKRSTKNCGIIFECAIRNEGAAVTIIGIQVHAATTCLDSRGHSICVTFHDRKTIDPGIGTNAHKVGRRRSTRSIQMHHIVAVICAIARRADIPTEDGLIARYALAQGRLCPGEAAVEPDPIGIDVEGFVTRIAGRGIAGLVFGGLIGARRHPDFIAIASHLNCLLNGLKGSAPGGAVVAVAARRFDVVADLLRVGG